MGSFIGIALWVAWWVFKLFRAWRSNVARQRPIRAARRNRSSASGDPRSKWRDLVISVLTVLAVLAGELGYAGFGEALDALARAIANKMTAPQVPHTPMPGAPATPEAPKPPLAPPAPVERVDPMAASVRISSGNSGCSGTLFRMDATDQYWLLTCAHCVRSAGASVDVFGDGGMRLRGVVDRLDRRADICLVRLDERSRKYPVAKIAASPPGVGVEVWHHGFGVDRPGNVERGRVHSAGDSSRNATYQLRLSSGDSGSGIFRQDTGELVGLGGWTSGSLGGGASLAQVRAFLFGQAPPPAYSAPG